MVVDYSNKKPINNVAARKDEVMVPIFAEEIVSNYKADLESGLKRRGEGIDIDNLETWHLGGRKILVGFLAVRKEDAEKAIKSFWNEVNSYIESTRKKRCLISDGKGGLKRCPREKLCISCTEETFTTREVSRDKFLEAKDKDEENGWDPTSTDPSEETESIVILKMTLSSLINDLISLDPVMGKCISLLAQGYEKKDVIEKLNLPLQKTQAYNYIKKCQKTAEKLYYKKYN